MSFGGLPGLDVRPPWKKMKKNEIETLCEIPHRLENGCNTYHSGYKEETSHHETGYKALYVSRWWLHITESLGPAQGRLTFGACAIIRIFLNFLNFFN